MYPISDCKSNAKHGIAIHCLEPIAFWKVYNESAVEIYTLAAKSEQGLVDVIFDT